MKRIGLVLVSAIVLASCGGGGNGSDGGSGGGSPLFVDIEYQGAPSVTTPAVTLNGAAECDNCPPAVYNFGGCPAIDLPRSSAIQLTWSNRSTGAGGAASTAIVGTCSCLLSQCTVTYAHRWSASVPLAIGDNSIEVRASRPSGGSGLDSIAIKRLPSAIAGLVAVPGEGQVTLSWPSAGDAASYDLYFATSRDVSTTNGTKIAGVTSPYTHTGLADDVTHYFVLTTVINGFESPASEVAWATPGWRTEAIAATVATSAYRDASIATDSAGRAYVHHSFEQHIGSSVVMYNYYLTNAGGSWASLLVGNPLWVNAELVLDAADTVQVAYLGFPGVTRATLAAGAWAPDLVDSTGSCSSSLALDSAGKAHLAYYSSAGGYSVRYATNASGAWMTRDVEPLADLGCHGPGTLALGVDSTGAAHVAYPGEFPGYGLRYATNRGGSWAVSTIDPGNITRLALAVDANDKAHIAYTNNIAELKYATDVTGAWATEVLEDAGGPNHPAIALDAGGKVYVSYVDGEYGGELRYTTNAAGSWRLVKIDAADSDFGGSATDTAVAVDAQGKLHITYYRDGGLTYATNR